jgi:hypothetical protein
MAMLGLSEWKFIGGTEGNSFEIASRFPRLKAVNEWSQRRESRGEESRGKDLSGFLGKCNMFFKCATAYV